VTNDCPCACCQKHRQDADVAWIEGYKYAYDEQLLDALEAKITKTEPVERKAVQEWRN
jgi:hypothetical protein